MCKVGYRRAKSKSLRTHTSSLRIHVTLFDVALSTLCRWNSVRGRNEDVSRLLRTSFRETKDINRQSIWISLRSSPFLMCRMFKSRVLQFYGSLAKERYRRCGIEGESKSGASFQDAFFASSSRKVPEFLTQIFDCVRKTNPPVAVTSDTTAFDSTGMLHFG